MGLLEITRGELGAVEAERVMVGAILTDPSTLHDALEVLSPDDLHDPAARATLTALVACETHGRPITPETLRDELQAANAWNGIGGQIAISAMIDEGRCEVGLVDLLAGLVREWARARRMALALAACSGRAPRSAREVPAYLDGVSQAVHDAATDARSGAAQDIGAIAAGVLDAPADARPGVPWFMPSMRRFGDLNPGNLVILAARPKRGKSCFALQQAIETSASRPVLFVSCEMSKAEVGARALSIVGEIHGDATAHRRLYREEEMNAAIRAASALSRCNLTVLDRAGATLAEVRALARKIRAQHGDLALIVLDYLQLMSPPERRKGGTREEEVSQLSRGSKQLAGDLGCAVLALSQLNRAADGQRPKLSNLRESGALEQDANSIVFLHGAGESDEALTEDVEVIVAAQRSGPTGSVPATLHRATTTFYDLTQRPAAGGAYRDDDFGDANEEFPARGSGYDVVGYQGTRKVIPLRGATGTEDAE